MSLAAIIERSHKEHESWRYTDLEKLLGAIPSSAPAAAATVKITDIMELPSIMEDVAERHQIVFVNGLFRPDVSKMGEMPPGVISGGKDNEYRLTLEGQTCLITAPIELIFLTSHDSKPVETSTKLRIEVGPSGRLTFIEHHMGVYQSNPSFVKCMDTEIHMGAQSKVMHAKILHGTAPSAHLATTRAFVSEGAYYRNFALIKGRRLVRNEVEVTLAGKMAQCVALGIMLLRGKEHADTSLRITHASPLGSSSQLYKSIVKDQARGVFQGKIVVAEDAQKTDAQQLSRALLLSDQAEMDAKPELEIYADDVKCSHGCTVGDLDSDAMFYLRSRGLPQAEARALLLHGFIDEVVDMLTMPEGRNYVRKATGRWLDEQD